MVTLLGALAGAFGTAYASSETFRTGVNSALTAVANTAQNALSTVIGWLDRLSFKLNKALNKDGYSTFDTYEGWKASQYKSTVTDADRQRRQQLHDSRVQQAQTEKELADLTGGGSSSATSRPPPVVPHQENQQKGHRDGPALHHRQLHHILPECPGAGGDHGGSGQRAHP